MAEVYVCPGCGRPVVEGEKYLVTQEYENAPDFGQRDFEPEALAKSAKRRFHVGHFHKRIGNLVFEVERD